MSQPEQTYDEGRSRNLVAMLVALSARIAELNARGELLRHAGELNKLIGDVRSELFHYEVRVTYDTPEVAESRRIVRDALETRNSSWERTEWMPDGNNSGRNPDAEDDRTS